MRLRFLLFSFCMMLGAAAAMGASVVPVTFAELVAQSSRIAHGEVVSTNSHWDDSRTTIVTDVRLRTLESFKGAAGDIVLTELGGTVGALKVAVEGVAPFEVGDEVIVFVKQTTAGLQITGATQGRFDVVTDPRNGQKFVRGLSLDTPAAGKAGAPARMLDLQNFNAKLRQQVSQPEQSDNQGGQ